MTLIEQLVDLQTPSTVCISPNCQQVLYESRLVLGQKKGENEISTIWLAETGQEKSSRQLTSGLYNDHTPRWSPDGGTVAFISDRAKQGESCAVYMLPMKAGGEAYPLTSVENEKDIDGFEFSPNGAFIAFISPDETTAEKKAKKKDKDDAKVWGEDWQFNRLRLLHVGTKKVTTLVSRDAHVVDLAWNDEGTKIAFVETRTPDIESSILHGMRISIIDISSKEIKAVCTFRNDVNNLIWLGDDLYFTGGVTPESTVTAHMVYRIDLSSKSPMYEKYAHGKEDCAGELGKAGQDMTILVFHGMEDQIRMLDGNTLFTTRHGIKAWDAKFTSDSDEMILAVAKGDTNNPPEVFTRTASGGALVQLSNHGSAFADRTFGQVNFLSCQSADNEVRLDSVYITPHKHATADGKPAKPLPTVVVIHGGPYSHNTDEFNPSYHLWSNVLLDAGYGVLLPNYRGSSGRGEAFAAYCRGSCGTYDHADVITMTQNSIEEGYADKDRLIVGGWSQGGFLSYLAIVRNGLHEHGWKFKGAIPGAGVSDGDVMSFTSDIGICQADLAGKAPWKCDRNDTNARAASAVWEFAAAVEKGGVIPPVLILHGEQDERVPIEQAVGFRRALEDAGLPFEMVTYPREHHILRERKHIIDMAERVVRFVDLHIGGK